MSEEKANKSIHVSLRWGRIVVRIRSSLAYLWSTWYREYYLAGDVVNYDNTNDYDYNIGMKIM